MFPSDTNLEAKFTLESEKTGVVEDKPFHILLMGGFGGEKSFSDSESLRSIEIDRDNFDDVMKKLRVRLRLTFPGSEENVISLEFNELNDFHPDSIFERLPLFAQMRDIRQKLSNSHTFDAAAREVRSWLSNDSKQETNLPNLPDSSTEIDSGDSENLLDQILEGSKANVSGSQTHSKSELSKFIEQIVEPHLVKIDRTEQSDLLIFVDEIISDLMRRILHHPDFQTLESAWRGAFFLIRRVETDSELKIFLADVNKDDLITNLKSHNNLADSKISRLFVQNENFWALVCGNYPFDLNVDDVAALMRLAQLAQAANAPFISQIKPQMFGINSLDSVPDRLIFSEDSTESKLWTALRSMPESCFLGLSFQRFLSRVPYGETTEPTENFSFEEFKDSVQHNQFLWANPSIICAVLLAQTFRHSGWQIKDYLHQDLENLPLFHYEEGGEKKSKPCAEILLSEFSSNTIVEQGLIPLITFRDTDRIRLAAFQSISFSQPLLQAQWS